MHFLLPFALLVTSAFALTMNTPQDVAQCAQVFVSWNDYTSPVDVYYLGEGFNPVSGIVVSNYTGASTEWIAVVPAEEVVRLAVVDARDEFASSDPITVGGSDNESCLPSSS